MITQNRICICGGGSQAHVLAGVLGANKDVKVSLLTRQPGRWESLIKIIYLEQTELLGTIDKVSDDPREVIPKADVVLISTPSYAHAEILKKIRHHLREESWVGSFPGTGGYDWVARNILDKRQRIFGVQRAPYVCRTISYGNSVELSGIRPRLYLAAIPNTQASHISVWLERAINIPIVSLTNYLSVLLAPSNSVFHSSRLYSLLKDWKEGNFFDRKILFYSEWDNFASEVYGKCDQEIQEIRRAIPLKFSNVKSILKHYEITNLEQLTNCIRNIFALKNIYTPMIRVDQGYIPDFQHRFFQEDIPYGLVIIKAIAQIAKVPTQMIDEILYGLQGLLKTEYLIEGILSKSGTQGLPIPQNFGINTIEDLIKNATA